MTVEQDRGAISFGEKLLSVLAEGQFTATYKYAVILGLMDVCLEHSEISGEAPSSVTTKQLAEKILELYWPQAAPFRGGSILSQNSGRQAAIVARIGNYRQEHGLRDGRSVSQSASQFPVEHDALVSQVEWILIEMPLPRLQKIGSEIHEFFYVINWNERIRKRDFRSDDFDNTIRFVGSSADHLIRLSGLLRPLVKRQWAGLVSRLNQTILEDSELDEFLFGASRIQLSAVRGDLGRLQDGRCFYCHDRLGTRSDVDHFIPWARYPDNRLENLVIAHPSCNGQKSDHLAAPQHIANWVARIETQADDLAAIASDHGWVSHPERSRSVGRSLYLRLPEGARLWQFEREFVGVNREEVCRALRID